jgi:hypothetical protein
VIALELAVQQIPDLLQLVVGGSFQRASVAQFGERGRIHPCTLHDLGYSTDLCTECGSAAQHLADTRPNKVPISSALARARPIPSYLESDWRRVPCQLCT